MMSNTRIEKEIKRNGYEIKENIFSKRSRQQRTKEKIAMVFILGGCSFLLCAIQSKSGISMC